jgi:hypothetical protein
MSDSLRECLGPALQLQEELAAAGVDGQDLLFARADTSFWLGLVVSGKDATENRKKYFASALTDFDALSKAGPTSPAVRLQWAEAVRWSSVTPTLKIDEPQEKWRARAEGVARSLVLYEGVLQDIKDLGSSDPLLVSVVTATGRAYGNLGNSSAFWATQALLANDAETAAKAALQSLRSYYRKDTLYAPDRFARVKAANPDNKFMVAHSDYGEEAWMVGLLAGYARLSAAGATAPTPCQALIDHAHDPLRHAPGVLSVVVANVQKEGCERNLQNEPGTPATEYLLGRLYLYADRSGDRTKMMERFASAASGGYAMAFSNLASTERVKTCSLAQPLHDRYRYLVLRDHLQEALPALQKYAGDPIDEAVFRWLADEARSEPESTRQLPPLGSPLTVKFLEDKCS